MASRQTVKKMATRPIDLVFRYLQNRSTINVWLYENAETNLQGEIVGFDEYMNIVLDNAVEVSSKKGTKKSLGTVLLKGDNITMMSVVSA